MRKQRFLAVLLSAALAFTPVIDVMAEENAAQTEEGSSTGKTEESGEVNQTEVREDETKEQTVAGSVGDYIPSELDYNTPIYEPGFEAYGERELESKYPENGIEDIKAKYPSVRDQNPYGTCWAFASMGLAEFDLINDGSVTQDIDLSELQLAYFTYNSVVDPLGGTRGDYSKYYVENSGIEYGYLGRGGNYSMASRRLNQWVGPVYESKVPYSEASNVLEKGLPDEYAYSYDVAHLENTYMINIKSNSDEVKKQIKEHGAAGISYKENANGRHYINNSYCDTSGMGGGGHSVMIVGWDDNYSKDNFRDTVKPSNDGAWLVRNSWGESSGYVNNCEYFWMSYETYSLADTAWVFDFTKDNGYDNNYQIDGGLDLGTFLYSKPRPVANIFTTPKKEGVSSEDLKAVSVSFTSKTNAEYKIEIYTDLKTEGNPYSGIKQESATTEGITSYAGVYTIELENPVRLEPGTTYAVVVTTDAIDWERVDIVEANNGKKVWDAAVSSTDPKSYYCLNNYYWNEDQYGYNYCIKAFTTNNRDFGEKLDGYTVTLNGTVDLNYHMEIPKNIMQEDPEAYVEFTVNGEQRSRIKVKDAEDKGTTKVFTCNVAAKEMTSDITANLVVKGQKGKDHIYSVKEYADQIIKNSSGGYSPEAINLVKAMLNYGASAQNFFNFKSEKLANASLDEADKKVGVAELAEFSKYKGEIEDASDMGINYYGSSLSLNADTNVKDYFTLSEGHKIDEYSFSYETNGKSIEVKPGTTLINNETHYYVDIPGIAAQHLDKEIVVTIKRVNDGKTVTWKYNPFSYGYVVKEKAQDNKELNAVMDALYLYWQRADAYMKSMK